MTSETGSAKNKRLLKRRQPATPKGAKTQQAILEAASWCIARKGVEQTTFTQIAKRAGVSRGLIVHHFRRKSELFSSVIRYILQAGYEVVSGFDPSLPWQAQIVEVHRRNIQYFAEHSDHYQVVVLLHYYSRFNPQYRVLNSQVVAAAEERFRKLLQASRLPQSQIAALANDLHNSLLGAVIKFHSVENKDLEDSVKSYLACVSRRLREVVQSAD